MPAERLPPAQPAYVFRGHAAQVHALTFTHENARLLSGDADGWVISWNIAYKRPTSVWKAHENAVLGLAAWGERVITHGRDNKLIVWQLVAEDEASLGASLPIDQIGNETQRPNVLHSLTVNALNFCSFAWCYDPSTPPECLDVVITHKVKGTTPLLIAVPHNLDSDGIDVYTLPAERRFSTIAADKSIKTGMVMALHIGAEGGKLQIIAGYESGHTVIYVHNSANKSWQKSYVSQPHSQPVLSLAVSPSNDYYLTSSADAIIAKHPLLSNDTDLDLNQKPIKLLQTKHSGQQGLSIRSDGRIFSTAGWDGRIRVYSVKTMKELAVLKWHKDGCFATAFAKVYVIVARNAENVEASGPTLESEPTQNQQPLSAEPIEIGSSSHCIVSQRREYKAQTTHWLAAGSKDGKVSLWDMY